MSTYVVVTEGVVDFTDQYTDYIHSDLRYFDHVSLYDLCYTYVFRENVSVPVFSNGNIQFLRDVDKCLEETKCDGVMIAGKV